jgi:NADH-quinone oxidoreductase subunit L
VSALIHAATMVVAGVYLVVRLFPVFALTGHGALEIVAYVGVFSSLFAAIIACTQTDIKRVLAYSTISQIGFMMFALGVSGYGAEAGLGYTASMFHLFTHAVFKALLFLGAGAVIHYVHSNEIRDMGGLRKLMPVTHFTFLLACLAIAGIPPFAGFFSKEEILMAAWQSNKIVFYAAMFTATLTAFYIFRLYFSIFWSKEFQKGATPNHDEHTHGEGPWSMLGVLIILGILSAVAGFVPFGNFVSSDGQPMHSELHLGFSIAPVLLALFGIFLALFLYKRENDRPNKIAIAVTGLYRTVYRKFYIDEFYLFITRKIIYPFIGRPAAWIDKNIVDGGVNGIASLTETISHQFKTLQSGKLQDYALFFISGLIGFVLLILYLWI